MTLIGPRPERPEFVAQLEREIPFYALRHAIMPGLTGWAQMRYHYGNTVEDAKCKLEYDLYYKNGGPLWMELSSFTPSALSCRCRGTDGP
jgi:lipopolysaccharide/colanic/teichoic acid biosynthesis glycosyltransferase